MSIPTPLMVFEVMVELANKGRGADLLGGITSLACQTFDKSLIGGEYPSFWLEAPLAGEPGFDLHVYYDRGQVKPGERFAEGCGFGMQALFDWYFGKETGGIGVGFAHDLRSGQVATGAYVNFNRHPLTNEPGFFEALGAQDSLLSSQALMGRLPQGWSPWYLGLFPARAGSGVRVGSFVSKERRDAYASDPTVLARDLERAGFEAFDAAMLERLQAMAALPFVLELQLDATPDGTGDTLGADLTMSLRSAERVRQAFAADGAAARAGKMLEDWGVADRRWRAIADASFSRMLPISQADNLTGLLMNCVPAFIKEKWVATRPQTAKVYLHCEARMVDRPRG